MANIKSQIKRNKQNDKIRLENASKKSEVKTIIKKTKLILESEASADEKKAQLNKAYKIIDTVANKNIIKKNNAARKKSSLAKLMQKI